MSMSAMMNVGSCGGCGSAGQTQQSQQAGGLQQLMQALFNQVDSDSDGSISQTEFASLMNQADGAGASSITNTSDLFKSIDTDGDGQISLGEFKKFAGGMFAAQVGAASSSSSGGFGSAMSGMLDTVTHAAEDLFSKVFGDGSSLPPGTTATASVHATMFENGGFMVSASVSETTTHTLTNAATGQVAASSGATQLAAALSSYHRHHHHGAGLAQLFGQMDGNGDGSVSSDELGAFINGTSGADTGNSGGSATA
jgi:hypothetical protein